MGYDLHIARTREWTEASTDPIGLDEWVEAARAHPALSETDEVGPVGADAPPTFVLGTDPLRSPALYWDDGQIVVRGAGEEHIAGLVGVAVALGARVVGDDGEEYDAAGTSTLFDPGPDEQPDPPSRRRGLFRRR